VIPRKHAPYLTALAMSIADFIKRYANIVFTYLLYLILAAVND